MRTLFKGEQQIFITGAKRRKVRGREFPDRRVGFRMTEEDENLYKSLAEAGKTSNQDLRARKRNLSKPKK